MFRLPHTLTAALLVIGLSGCGNDEPARDLNALDAELTDAAAGNARDPAMMAALQDQIMVDPALAAQSNTDAVRPPSQPYSGALPADGIAASSKTGGGLAASGTSEKLTPTPAAKGACPQCSVARESLTLGALAARQTSRPARSASCTGSLSYSARWATRLPGDVPLYPDARVTEAAGNDARGCQMRAVSFATSAPLQRVLDYYYTRTTKAGFSAEHQADASKHVLAGTRARDDGAFAIFLTSRRDGGTDVDIVANRGS